MDVVVSIIIKKYMHMIPFILTVSFKIILNRLLIRLTADLSNEPKGYYVILFIYDKNPSEKISYS